MIDRFDGDYSFLSNFYFHSDGETVEHLFQAAKAITDEDREYVLSAASPGVAKKRGRAISLRPDWESVKADVMLALLRKKFAIPELKEKLLGTGDQELVEGNMWHDNYFGDCACHRCKEKIGYNKLGQLLMQIRDELRSELKEKISHDLCNRTITAECTWGDGPDVLVEGHNFPTFNLSPVENSGSIHGRVRDWQVDLTADEADRLGADLIMAAARVRELNQICEDHDSVVQESVDSLLSMFDVV